jgi:hypothetical protein
MDENNLHLNEYDVLHDMMDKYAYYEYDEMKK